MAIVLFAAEHLLLKHPSVQWGRAPGHLRWGGFHLLWASSQRRSKQQSCVLARLRDSSTGQTQHGPWLQGWGQRHSEGSSAAGRRRHSPRAIAILSSAVGCQQINFAWD